MLSDATANRESSLFPTDVQIMNTILDQLVDVLDEYADSETIMEQAEVHSNLLIIIYHLCRCAGNCPNTQ